MCVCVFMNVIVAVPQSYKPASYSLNATWRGNLPSGLSLFARLPVLMYRLQDQSQTFAISILHFRMKLNIVNVGFFDNMMYILSLPPFFCIFVFFITVTVFLYLFHGISKI